MWAAALQFKPVAAPAEPLLPARQDQLVRGCPEMSVVQRTMGQAALRVPIPWLVQLEFPVTVL